MAQRAHVTPTGMQRQKVVVEQRVDSGGGGFPVDMWVPLLTLWMEKVDLLGTEAWRADQLQARYTVRFIAQYAPALDPEIVDVPATHRLQFRGQTYDITNAQIVGNFEGIEYHATTSTQSEGA
jgi:SPP1 family predicted phage head-tail adaptor